ncbi:antibiotic biosynthesis monooxygenase family protein [Staphylococcus sp. 11261D007BR]
MNLCHHDKLYVINEEQDITIYKNNELKTYTVLSSIGELEPQTYCVLNYIKVNPEKAPVLESQCCCDASDNDDVEGFKALRILKPNHPDNYYLIMTLWDSEDDFSEWLYSQHYYQIYNHTNFLKMYDYDVIDPKTSYRIKFNTA